MAKISYTVCLGLFPAFLAQFTLKMRFAARNREKFAFTILGFKVIQGHRC